MYGALVTSHLWTHQLPATCLFHFSSFSKMQCHPLPKPLVPSARPRQWEEKSSCFLPPTGNRRHCRCCPVEEDEGTDTAPSLPFHGGETPLINPVLSFLIHSRSAWPCSRKEALSTLAYSKEQFISTNSILTLWREQRCPENAGSGHLPSASCATQAPFTPQDNVASTA